MKQIVILGSSPAGVTAIEEIRKSDTTSAVTVIAFDGHYPYNRGAFAPFIAKNISPENVFCRPKDFFERNNIKLIFDKKISRINFNRKKIFTEDKEQIDFDILLIVDTPENRFPNVKGTNKGSVYGYKKLKDIDKIVNDLPIVKTVVIQSDSFTGLQAAVSFVKREKEVILVTSNNNFLRRYFEPDVGEWIKRRLQERGLRVFQENPIKEILGDKEAKAVRLQSGKVFSAEAIIFIETDEDLRLFSGSDLRMDKKISVSDTFQTSIENVFAADQVCDFAGSEPVTPFSVLQIQGEMIAAAVNGEEKLLTQPLCSWSAGMDGLKLNVLGNIEDTDAQLSYDFDPENGSYKGLYVKNGILIGAILINKEGEIDTLTKSICEKTEFEHTGQNHDSETIYENEASGGSQSCENVSTEVIDN